MLSPQPFLFLFTNKLKGKQYGLQLPVLVMKGKGHCVVQRGSVYLVAR